VDPKGQMDTKGQIFRFRVASYLAVQTIEIGWTIP